MFSIVVELRAVLPYVGDANVSIENQARSVLNLLLDLFEKPAQARAFVDDPLRCPNCQEPAQSLTGPYCCENCRDQAAFVRQFRAAVATHTILDPQKQVVFGERLWWLLGGGLPMRESRIPESAKRQVAKRSDGKCETCGEPMIGVENVGSGCNRPLHLRAVCAGCSNTKFFGDPVFSHSPEVLSQLNAFAARIANPQVLHQCDDPDKWDWRAFMAKRRESTR